MRNDMTAAWCIMKHDVTWLTNGRGIAELQPLGRKECKPLTELKRERERERSEREVLQHLSSPSSYRAILS